MSDHNRDSTDTFETIQNLSETSQNSSETSQDSSGHDHTSSHSASGAVVPSGDYLPERIYLLPIHNRPFFPAQVQPLIIQRQRWEETMKRVANTPHHMVGVAFVGDVGVDELNPGSFPEIGTAVKVHRTQNEDQQIQFIAQGMRRFRIQRWLSKTPPYLVEVSYPREPVDAEAEAQGEHLPFRRDQSGPDQGAG